MKTCRQCGAEHNLPRSPFCCKNCGNVWAYHNKPGRRESMVVNAKRYRDSDEGRERVAARRHTDEYRAKAAARNRAYMAEHPEARKRKDDRWRALEKNATYEDVDYANLEESCPTCYLCGEDIDYSLEYPDPMSRSLDHVVPLIAGGSHTRDNLAYTHLRCNVRKGAKPLNEVLAA